MTNADRLARNLRRAGFAAVNVAVILKFGYFMSLGVGFDTAATVLLASIGNTIGGMVIVVPLSWPAITLALAGVRRMGDRRLERLREERGELSTRDLLPAAAAFWFVVLLLMWAPV